MTRRAAVWLCVVAAVWVVVCSGANAAADDGWPTDHAVVELTDDMYAKYIENGVTVPTLVEFYMPTCGHCQAFAPAYDLVGKDLKTLQLRTAKVNVVEERATSQKNDIVGVPTVKLFMPNDAKKPITYTEGRTQREVVAWVLGKTKQGALSVANPDTLSKYLPNDFHSPIPRLVLLTDAKIDDSSRSADLQTIDTIATFLTGLSKNEMQVLKVYNTPKGLFGAQSFPALVVVDWTAESAPFKSEHRSATFTMGNANMPYYHFRGPLDTHLAATGRELEAELKILHDFSASLIEHVEATSPAEPGLLATLAGNSVVWMIVALATVLALMWYFVIRPRNAQVPRTKYRSMRSTDLEDGGVALNHRQAKHRM